MPRFITLGSERETVTLHAPWWAEKEHVVIYAQMSERDEQWIQQQVQPKIRPGQGRDAMSISMQQVAFTRRYLLLRMVREITDEEGHPLPVNGDLIDSMAKRDSEWLNREIEELNKPLVEPTEEDEAEAERDGSTESAGEIAHRKFRRAR